MKGNQNHEAGDLDQPSEHSVAAPDNNVQLALAAIWSELQILIKDVVQQMNSIEEIRQRTGGLDFHHGPLDTIIVTKESLPAVYLTLSCGTAAMDVYWRIVVPDGSAKEQELRERLTIELEPGRLLFQNKLGASLTTEQAVFYILRPFLHPALLFS